MLLLLLLLLSILAASRAHAVSCCFEALRMSNLQAWYSICR